MECYREYTETADDAVSMEYLQGDDERIPGEVAVYCGVEYVHGAVVGGGGHERVTPV